MEELAAQERAASNPSRRPVGHRRSLVIALATCLVMITGASAFALARTGPNPTMVQPYGPHAPFGVGYVDGFGEHSPKPTRKPPTSRSKPRPSSSSTAEIVAEATILMPTAGPGAAAAGQIDNDDLSAVYWTNTWNSNYDTYVWVGNDGTESATWEVRIKLPPGATINTTMAARKSYVDGTWVFTPTRSPLRAGRVYLFAFSGNRKSGPFALSLCLINGADCVRFR